jgi:ABC-2 type transport system ATP-binding protein
VSRTYTHLPLAEVVLQTKDLGYAYVPERFAIRHLSIEVHRGEVFGLLGRNGAGKTTTLRILTTLLPPTEGSATILGYDVRTGGRALRSHLGVVLQSESLDFVTVERNLTLYGMLWGVPREVAKARAEEMLTLFELQHVRLRKPWALSGGERRRFQVARELIHDMEVLFLDEPTVGLDAVARRRILRYLRERARGGLSILFTTHILHEADMLCDRIAVLHEGKLTALDTPEGLKRRFGGAREVSVTFAAALRPEVLAELQRDLAAHAVSDLRVRPASEELGERVSFRSERAEQMISWVSSFAHERALTIEGLTIREATLEGAFLGLVGLGEGEDDESLRAESPGRSRASAGGSS